MALVRAVIVLLDSAQFVFFLKLVITNMFLVLQPQFQVN